MSRYPGVLLPTLVVIALSLVTGATPFASGAAHAGHGPSLHDQWQPQTMPADPRLSQTVEIDIIGRAAIRALALLSEKTGVTLRVAPEDVETVGERKFTVIAQGCSLKAIMLQLPKALQECHWDIDPSGPDPVYLLHRNGGADAAMARLAQAEWGADRERREQRVNSARRALSMSPGGLAALAETDPLLAASAKDPATRAQMELFLSLPAEAMEEFLAEGSVAIPYTTAPRRFQQAALEVLRERLDWARRMGNDDYLVRSYSYGLSNPDDVMVRYVTRSGIGTVFAVSGPADTTGEVDPFTAPASLKAMPPKKPAPNVQGLYKTYRDLLVSTGLADETTAGALVEGLTKEYMREELGMGPGGERVNTLEWREPRSRKLHRVVALPFTEEVEPVEVQRYVATETGLSIISDYFTSRESGSISTEARRALPVWELLYLLSETRFWSYDWEEAGDCLVFHDHYWYRKAPVEFPESLAEAYRRKLEQQGRLTLDDVAAVAVELERRRPPQPPWPQGMRIAVAVPEDLRQAGLTEPNEALLIYAALTSEQRAAAHSKQGLPYREMTAQQQELVRRSVPRDKYRRPLPEEQVVNAVYWIVERSELRDSEAQSAYDLVVRFPSRGVVNSVVLDVPKPSGP